MTAPRTTFRAAVVVTPDGPDSVQFVDVPVAVLEPGQVRVAVAAATVNPADLLVLAGVFHDLGVVRQPEHTGLGWDFAGTVLEAAPDVDLAPGTRVAGLLPGFDRDVGTYAEQVVVPATDVALVPDGLGLVEAALVTTNALTAAQLVDILGDGEGRTLLVTGAAGALGGYIVPLAIDRGWRVTGLARDTDTAFVRSFGADIITEPTAGWDAVADPAALQQQAVALVRDGGRFVGVHSNALPRSERDVEVRAVRVKPDSARTALLLQRTASGELPARAAGVLPLDEVSEAHHALAKGGLRGRFVVQP